MIIDQKCREFLTSVSQGLQEGKFIKLSLGNYKGDEDGLKRIYVKKILIKREEKLSFTYHYKTRDIVKNYSTDEGLSFIDEALKGGFYAATLFTSEFDLMFEKFGDKAILKKSAPTNKGDISLDHNRTKKRLIESHGKSYLTDLKITDGEGNVYKNAQDKFRQINKYIEILAPLIANLPSDRPVRAVDMGAGKGYLTFALYDYLTNVMKKSSQVIGVEYRKDMVDLCNSIAGRAGFEGLSFVQGTIDAYEDPSMNVLIALHACDTATDDAIYKGIKADADLIVVAPCCHKQIRREIEASSSGNDLDYLMRHGIFLERQAEMVTDGIRALILEYAGYATKVFEFISGEHTAKNVMIVAEKKSGGKKNDPAILNKITQAKAQFGIQSHYLEKIAGI